MPTTESVIQTLEGAAERMDYPGRLLQGSYQDKHDPRRVCASKAIAEAAPGGASAFAAERAFSDAIGKGVVSFNDRELLGIPLRTKGSVQRAMRRAARKIRNGKVEVTW